MSDAPLILLVEDDENDIFFLRRAWDKAGLALPLQIVRDGKEAMDYLAGEGKFGDRAQFPLPSLVFLDLKLPYVGGLDVLAWIRSQPDLKQLPVVILTSSSEDRDRKRAAELAARGYLVKPPTAEMIRSVVEPLLADAG
jgi:CheY-like chemotaxis protein